MLCKSLNYLKIPAQLNKAKILFYNKILLLIILIKFNAIIE